MIKAFITIIGVLFLPNTYAGSEMKELRSIIDNDQWAVSEGTHNDLPLMVRFRNKLEPEINISNHPQLMQIYWNYSEHNSGMPSKKDSGEMETFENRLVNALENDLTGILTAVITTNGFREWVYYTTSIDAFAEKLHNMPQENEPYPIEIETDNDSGWEYFFNHVRPQQ